MYNSDVDDTAESSTDDEYVRYPPSLDATGYPVQHLGGTSNTSKKLIKMVDKVAESKLFQAATENKYIKRAIESKILSKIVDDFLIMNLIHIYRCVKYGVGFKSRDSSCGWYISLKYTTAPK